MVTVDYKESTTNTDEYLRYSQIIIDAFTKALDQNDCTVKILIGTYDQIQEQKETVEDLVTIVDGGYVTTPSTGVENTYIGSDLQAIVYTPNKKVTPETISAIKARLKNRCIDCDLKFPKLDFSNNLKFSLDKLKVSLNAYISTFQDLVNPNFCQSSTVFNFACLQDLIKLIVLFLSVFSAILGLKKLSNISLKGLIRGIISGLLGILIGKLKLQLDASQTGIKCLIEAIKKLALNIPDGESLNGYMEEQWFVNEEQKELLKNTTISADRSTITIPVYEDYTTSKGSIEKRVSGYRSVPSGYTTDAPKDATNTSNKSFFNQDSFQKAMSNLSDSGNQNYVKQFAKALEKDASDYEKIINNSFKYISDTTDEVINMFNEEISKVFGLLEYFQCELSRSGTDFIDILDFMKRIINVINLLSSIVAILAKKQVKKLCKSKSSTYDLSEEVKEALRNTPNDLDPSEIIAEYMGQVVDSTVNGSDDIIPLIYNQPKDTILPKLSMETCNLKEFIEAHTLDNIISKVIEDIRADEDKNQYDVEKEKYFKQKESNKTSTKYNDKQIKTNNFTTTPNPKTKTDSTTETIPLTSTNNGRWTLYPIQYVTPKISNDFETEGKMLDEESYKDLSTNIDKSFGVNTILDFIYNNPESKIKNRTQESSDKASEKLQSNTEDSVLNTPKNNEYNPESDVYLNKCRSIDDVLSILERVKSK